MQFNVLYAAIVSTGVAISSAAAVKSRNTSSWSNSPLDVTAWAGPNCTGYLFDLGDISRYYNWQLILPIANPPFSSFRLSRPLEEGEQLDLSQASTYSCERILRSYWHQDSPAGCANLNAFECFRIWLNTTSLTTTSSTTTSSTTTSSTTTSSTTTSSTTTSANAGATLAFAEDTFYRLSNKYLGTGYSVAIKDDNGPQLNMAITSDDSRQHWQIKRIPNTDNQYWFACQFVGENHRLFLDPSDLINPLMAKTDDTVVGQQWIVRSKSDGTWRISNALSTRGNTQAVWDWLLDWGSQLTANSNTHALWGPQLSTYGDTHALFMDMKDDTGTVWSISEARKITPADGFL